MRLSWSKAPPVEGPCSNPPVYFGVVLTVVESVDFVLRAVASILPGSDKFFASFASGVR